MSPLSSLKNRSLGRQYRPIFCESGTLLLKLPPVRCINFDLILKTMGALLTIVAGKQDFRACCI